MQHRMLKTGRGGALTMFFCGWGTDWRVLNGAATDAENVMSVWDYADMTTTLPTDGYERIDVVAWSMGVWAAWHYMSTHPTLPWGHTTAVNGTGKPCDNSEGIAPTTVKATADNWSETIRRKFNMRMCGGRAAAEALQHCMSERDAEDQKAELYAIIQKSQEEPLANMTWDVALVGGQDLIFLPQNQHEFWGTSEQPKRAAKVVTMATMAHWPDLTQMRNAGLWH